MRLLRRGWMVAGLLTGLSGCASAPAPEAMARAIVAAQPSAGQVGAGDWSRLRELDAGAQARLAAARVERRAYAAGLARLDRDPAYREAVARAMLAGVGQGR